MNEDIKSIEKNKTWELVNYSYKKTIDVRWVYKLKLKPNGEISKHKAKFMIKGFFFKKSEIDFMNFMHHMLDLKP